MPLHVLGIQAGHNATVALLRDGEIIACASEERFTRKKNQLGFPKKAVAFALTHAGITIKQVDKVVIAGLDPRSHLIGLHRPDAFMSGNVKSRPQGAKAKAIDRVQSFLYHHPRMGRALHTTNDNVYRAMRWKSDERRVRTEFAHLLGCEEERISFLEHHTAHALALAFNLPRKRKTLLLTLDGEGDGICATVGVFDGTRLRRIASTPKDASIGWLYMNVTKHLGMKGNEHEFKVMGMAPYGKADASAKTLPILREAVGLDQKRLVFTSSFELPYADRFLNDRVSAVRFDTLSRATQELTEELIIAWALAAIKRTGIHDLAIAGGVFMNVKANQKLLELREVRSLFVMPSAGDESLPIGCCWQGYQDLCKERGAAFSPKPITHLYLGQSYDDAYIERMIKRDKLSKAFDITRPADIEDALAQLLAEGKVVARHQGRSEWGARALGNRSILANPVSEETIQVINELIKDRDFWMPFTPSILPEGEKAYVVNPKRVPAPYMCLTFDSTPAGRRDLKAAKHPYDHTVRPQVVYQEWNPGYHHLISKFAERTGIKGILNTSFNLHGEPNVETPEDSIRTVLHSGLECVAIGSYLFRKKGTKKKS